MYHLTVNIRIQKTKKLYTHENIQTRQLYVWTMYKRREIRWPLTTCFLKVIIWLGQTFTFSWVITMVHVSFGTCCHGYHVNAIDISLSMCSSYHSKKIPLSRVPRFFLQIKKKIRKKN